MMRLGAATATAPRGAPGRRLTDQRLRRQPPCGTGKTGQAPGQNALPQPLPGTAGGEPQLRTSTKTKLEPEDTCDAICGLRSLPSRNKKDSLRHALRLHRPQSVPPHRRGGQHHPWRRALEPGAGGGLHPHPQDGTGLRRRAPGARAPGRDADPGRAHAAAARARHPGADRAAEGGPVALRARAGRPGAGPVQHQCAHRVPARDAELLPHRLSRHQRRSGGAPVATRSSA